MNISSMKPGTIFIQHETVLIFDFITKIESEITLIKVKAKTGTTKSSKELLTNKEKYKEVNKLIRLKECNIGETDNILSIPYYLAFLL